MSDIEKYFHDIFILSGRICLVCILIPVLIALWNKKHLNTPLKIFVWYCLVTLLINITEHLFVWSADNYKTFWLPILKKWGISDTSFLQIFYYLKDFALLGWFYALLLPLKYSIWVKRIASFLFLATLINYLFIEGYNTYGVFNPAADAIFSFVLPSFYLWYLYRHLINFPLNKNVYFWISFGLIFTNLIGLFLYLVGDAIHKMDYVLFTKMSIIRNIFDMISQVIFAIGFWYAYYVKYLPQPNEKAITA